MPHEDSISCLYVTRRSLVCDFTLYTSISQKLLIIISKPRHDIQIVHTLVLLCSYVQLLLPPIASVVRDWIGDLGDACNVEVDDFGSIGV